MAYETGTATTPADLLTKLITFASANGWTVNTPLSGKVFINGAVLVGAKDQTTSLDARGAITYAVGNAWDAQTNNAGVSHVCDIEAGPYTRYHFYATTELTKVLLAAIIEMTAGIFRHWVICNLIQYGVWTGGTYTDSVNWDTSTSNANRPDENTHRVIGDANNLGSQTGHAWIDYDAKTNNWQVIARAGDLATTKLCGSVRNGGLPNEQVNKGYARWNERAVGVPIELFANRASSLRSPMGRIPNMRFVNMLNYTPGELVTVGSDTWQLFPIAQRTTTWGSTSNGITSSGPYGYAYKR